MTASARHPPSAEFLTAFQRAAGAEGVVSFARFVELALYDPQVGYYTRRRTRIGRHPDADFYTAAALGSEFGALVAQACAGLLQPAAPAAHTFVEIGAEREWREATADPTLASVLSGIAHPFASATTVSLGQPIEVPSPSVVFSNELLDAQPFHRVVRQGGAWRELGVALHQGALEEVLLPELTPEVRAWRDPLPAAAPEGYRLDLPLAAAALVRRIVAQPWTGLFVAFDYGKSWPELAADTPAGTARAYHRHRQCDDLLARPGEQDLTCHVCWDWIAAELAAHGFAEPSLESQEAFFVRHAAAGLRALTAAEAGRFSARKLEMLQLLHPGNLGRKFQVLWARRARMPAAPGAR